ncbi:MAG: hypothetical protein HQ523_02910 [Lentisphaerae bacterium]|nr:hypothetical protein [Lentisphaerota bacterium]
MSSKSKIIQSFAAVLLLLLPLSAQAAPPVLGSTYLNPLYVDPGYTNAPWHDAYTNTAGFAFIGGLASPVSGPGGPASPTGGLVIAQSSFGEPIVGVRAGFGLGDVLTPPDGANIAVAPLLDFLGGGESAIWLDYARLLIATDVGAVEVTWTLFDSTTQTVTYTLSPAPSRRPVRLYWTEGQNAGPTIHFGSNYKVDIFYNSQISDTNDVWIAENLMHAAAGVKGRFLLTYSRLDEATQSRVLLAYEVVEVLEPMSALLQAEVGQRLYPQTRPYPIEDLYAEITRGALDLSGQDSPYVHQQQQGPKKGWVWAIRETAAAWQVEVYWKAKEELDVLWPFEVDIYNQAWGPSAQIYVRGDTADGDYEPKVQLPIDLTVAAMLHQKPEAHAFVEDQTFYSISDGYSLLKIVYEDNIWFQAVHSVSHLDPLVYDDTNSWVIASELRPVVPGTRDSLDESHGAWPGYLYLPAGQYYNVGTYAYPTTYTDPAELASYLFAVNQGSLEVWWSNGNQQDGMPDPLYFPSLVNRYVCDWPKQSKEIVIASGLGNQGFTLNIDNTGCVHFDRNGLPLELAQRFGSHLWVDNPNNLDLDGAMTLELWINPDNLTGTQYLIYKGRNYRLRLNNGVPEVYANSRWFTADSGVVAGVWQHLAVSLVNSGDVTFYLDGLEIGTRTIAGGLRIDPVAAFRLGAQGVSSDTPEDFYNGRMDEVRIWKTRRTNDEIRDHMIATVDPSAFGLRGYFRFEPNELAAEGVVSDSSFFINNFVMPPRSVAFEMPGIRQVEPGISLEGVTLSLYEQNQRAADGFNPNEEHAIILGSTVYALRNDLNVSDTNSAGYTSPPYVLLNAQSPLVAENRPYMMAFRVTASNELYEFKRFMEAGLLIQPPAPIALMPPTNLPSNEQIAGPRFRDRKGYYWAKQAGDDGGATNYVFDYYYPMQTGFYFPALTTQPALGSEIAWLDVLSGNGTPIDFTYIVEWPEEAPSLFIADTLTNAKDGLPAIRGQLSVNVLYQQSQALDPDKPSVLLIDPTVVRPAALEKIPPGMKTYRDVRSGNWFFSDLPPALRSRVFDNPSAAPGDELQMIGEYRERTDGQNYLLLNLLSGDNRAATTNESLVRGITGEGGDDWRTAIADLPSTVVALQNDETPFDSVALPTTGLGAGYVTVVFNDSENDVMVDPSEGIDMVVFKVAPILYRGRLDVILSVNPLDRQQSLYYTADFQGTPERWEFKWEWANPLDGAAPPVTEDSLWHDYVTKVGQHYVTVGDAGVFGLSDHYLRATYRALDADVISVVSTNWAPWTPPVLAEGWIKRVLKAVNPFEQRIRDMMNYAVLTDLSMLQQIGAAYNGDIPLNYEALNEYGLMQIYETIRHQAEELSLRSGFIADNGLALALLLVQGRLSDLYMVLGHEAYGDALNPMLLLGADDPVAAGDATSLFSFQNQVPRLLDEELALLRGRDADMNPPVSDYPIYNRLAWNITADVVGGQVAYMLNYGISDLKGNQNGVLDADDAAILYPQGHGDAYGHYLSALKGYYAYMHDPYFSWFPQVEGILVSDVEVTVSFLHEKKFAVASAARARAGEAIMNRVWRKTFRTDQAPWRLIRDGDAERAWGIGEWGSRVGQGAYFDWLTANSLLPTADPDPDHSGIRLIDRENVTEVTELAVLGNQIQRTMDQADAGLNPLGVARDAVPFDISSTGIDAGKTHFEQVYDRARSALRNAAAVHDRVRGASQAIRDQNESSDLDTTIQAEEARITRRLIEIYGYAYQDDIGPGKLYAQGYQGPDLIHYLYIESWPLDPMIGTDTRNITLRLTNHVYSAGTTTVGLTVIQSALSEVFNSAEDTRNYEISSAYYDHSNVVTVDVHVANNGIPRKPASYVGSRRAEGEIQIATSQYLAAAADAYRSLYHAQFISGELTRESESWLAVQEHIVQSLGARTDANGETRDLSLAVKAIRIVQATTSAADDLTRVVQLAILEAIPKVVGLATDATAPVRGGVKGSYGVVHGINVFAKVAGDIALAALNTRIKDIANGLERDLLKLDISQAAKQGGLRILSLQQQQSGELAALQGQLQRMETARMRLSAAISTGDQLQIERERLRMNWAVDLNARRYRNMAYRLFLNDELTRYDQAFDVAARYVYQAAKAYDYETGLLASDGENSAAGSFMRDITRARSLGHFSPWPVVEPLVGGDVGDPGLADIAARLLANWEVLKGRLSFNNPQQETGRFSLRQELFRISPDGTSDANWRSTLTAHRVPNLRDLPEFLRYCLPFDPMQDEEPALLITFPTTIDFRKNFFGRPLASGDNAYDSTHFSTKVRSAGVWFGNFNAAFEGGLGNQPRVYLFPAGMDQMRVPFESDSRMRRWEVVDQAMPLPFPISDDEWEQPDWSMLSNVLGNELYRTRRYPSMLAYHDSGQDDDQMVWNSRLIGRSVWNSRWVLIIPGGTLLSDAEEGLDRFIFGRETAPGVRDLNGVKDIKLYFHTYSYSGN